MNELVEIKKGQELETLTNGLNKFIKLVKLEVGYEDIDVDTKKGRDEVISNAFKVTKTKTGIAQKIDDLISSKEKEIEPTLKIIKVLKESKKITNSELGELSKSVRKVVTDWEFEEKNRIEVEKIRLKAEALLKEIESSHESALTENELFDMKLAKRLEEERVEREASALRAKTAQQERDKKIADDAAAKAKADAEVEKAQAIKDALEADERVKQAEINRLAAVETAKQQKIQAEKDAVAAKIQAKKDADDAAERARLAEVKRQNDKKSANESERLRVEANTRHVGSVRREIKEHLMAACKIDESLAKKVVLALLKTDRVTINY